MRQIKNKLSELTDIKTVLLLCNYRTKELEQLEQWIKKTKKCIVFYDISDKMLPNEIDAIIFDYQCEKALVKQLYRKLCPKYIIGRVKHDEDYFRVWEYYRGVSKNIFIERDRNLPKEKLSLDIASCEILDWHKTKACSVNQVELSIVIPIYNMESYLPICMKSLLKWEAPYVEYIFVNDGSTDSSRQIIKNYAKDDSRVILVEKENGGCASARNTGIRAAKGAYIGFVDPDDFIEYDMFKKLFKRAIMGNYDMAYCGYHEYYENTKSSTPVRNDCLKEPYLTGTYKADMVHKLAVKTRVALWRAIYRKDILKDNNIWFHEDLKRFDDLPFRVEYLFASNSAVCIPEYLYYYRIGRNGQDISCTDKRLFVHFKIFEHLDAYIEKFHDKRLQDLLQIVKICTHKYALSKLEKKYQRQYKIQARKQLDKYMGFWRTVILICMYSSKWNVLWYIKLKLMYSCANRMPQSS